MRRTSRHLGLLIGETELFRDTIQEIIDEMRCRKENQHQTHAYHRIALLHPSFFVIEILLPMLG
jgi:hypothetical protein